MAKLRINGDSSGYVDLEAPNAASSSTLDLDQVPQKNAATKFDTVLQVGSSSTITNTYGAPYGYVFDVKANSGTQSYMSIGTPSDTLGSGGLVMGVDGGAVRITSRDDKRQIFSTNNIDRMTIHSTTSGDGAVTMPHQPSFKAGLSSNTNVSTGSNIIFNSTSTYGKYNTGGHYSTTNGRFTAPVSGAYHFDVGLLYGPSIPDGTNFDDAAFLYLNGVLAAYDERRAEYVNGTTGNDGYYGTWIHTQLYMNSGDYVSVVNYNRFAGLHGNQRFTWFAGFLIG